MRFVFGNLDHDYERKSTDHSFLGFKSESLATHRRGRARFETYFICVQTVSMSHQDP